MIFEKNTLILGDNLSVLKTFPDACIDAIITDSPYGLGKEPNSHACLMDWLTKGYHVVKGSGFMGKKWDAFVPQPILWKECYRVLKPGGYLLSFFGTRTYDWGTLAIRLAGFEIRDCIQWIYGSGFPKSKSHLKPANEPICVARKPGPLADLGIEEARVLMKDGDTKGQFGPRKPEGAHAGSAYGKGFMNVSETPNGRWPANVILDEEAAEILDEQSGILKSGAKKPGVRKDNSSGWNMSTYREWSVDIGGASRFFYVAKASQSERAGRKHPTIKPVKLMEQLIKLYCTSGGVVLDPHIGSGTTAVACENTGRNWIGIDNDPDSIAEAQLFIQKHKAKPMPATLFDTEKR